ncbi:DUF6273 domain-containing protein [Adlercreutzia rubneri]
MHLDCRVNWWLRVVMAGSSANVCYVNNTGNANYNSASNAGIRPRFGFLQQGQTE